MKLRHIIATTLATMAISLPAQEVYDYCSPEQFKRDTFSLIRAGTKPKQGDVRQIKFGPMEKECLECHTPQKERSIHTNEIINNNVTGEYKILLVPIGYRDEEIPQRMETWIGELEYIYKGIDIDFAYLNHSVFLDIKETGRLPVLSNRKQGDYVEKILLRDFDIHKCVFVYKSKEAKGGRGKHLLVTGWDSIVSWYIGHELGHYLGLNDGYRQYYGERMINGTEFFMDYRKVSWDVRKAVEDIKPPYAVMPEAVCNGKTMYRFYPELDDIMEKTPSGEETKRRIESNEPFFNPMQRYIMKETIKKKLKPTFFEWIKNKF